MMSHYDLQLKAFTVLNRAANASQEVTKKHVLASDLNLTEFAVLELLYHKGEQPIQIIGKKVLIASSSITYVVDKLEQKGFVHRKSCANDRRVTYVELTGLGKQQIEEIFPTHEQKISEIFEVLSNEEMETLIILLKRIGHHACSI